MKLSDFDFELPEHLIATRPAKPRSSARMLVVTPETLTDTQALKLPDFLRPGDRLILNDTKVLPARLTGQRHRDSAEGPVSARIDVTLLEPGGDGSWTALLKPLKKVRDGERIVFSPTFSAVVSGRQDGQARLAFEVADGDFAAALDASGSMPLPPYIAQRRAADAQDREDYQTVWARAAGAVAAPTASLHFDDDLLAALEARGVQKSFVTLHVGAGTFLPVKVDDVSDHKMHAERGEVSAAAAAEIQETREAGGRIIAVGTTALRVLETAARETGVVTPWSGETSIFITPGFEFRAIDGLMTNFHLPKSTLMMLVSALMGRQRMAETYAHAIASQYRFFSYGDASLLLPKG